MSGSARVGLVVSLNPHAPRLNLGGYPTSSGFDPPVVRPLLVAHCHKGVGLYVLPRAPLWAFGWHSERYARGLAEHIVAGGSSRLMT